MKFSIPKTDQILNDKNVLYVVFVLAILNLLGYLLVQNTEAVVFFLIVGFLTTYFSKNMIIVLMVSMISTSLFTATRRKSASVSEGMSGQRQRQEVKDTVKSKAQEKKQSAQKNKSDEEEQDDDVEETATASHFQNRVDLAGTLDEAYGNLQKTVGKDGIKGLTDQSKSLLANQKQLMDNIETMQPFLETAQGFMDKLDLSNINGLGDMLGKLGGKAN